MATNSITKKPLRWHRWWEQIHWVNLVTICLHPLAGIACLWTPLVRPTLYWALIYYHVTGFSITGGYPRFWSHRSYQAGPLLKFLMCAFGAGTLQGSVRGWARNHRDHHRFTDTEKDPYGVQIGVLRAHLGWLILKRGEKQLGHSDISDLEADSFVMWQHRNYLWLAVFTAFILPSVVAGLFWEDWMGGLVYAGFLRAFAVQQSTFCVNSVAHWLGDQPYADSKSPRDNILTALLTMGEGYHNFHHEFPIDYRNGISWHHYDPTKWIIWACSLVGLTEELKEFSSEEIQKTQIQMERKNLDRRSAALNWGKPRSELPIMDWDEYERAVQGGEALIAIGGVIHDVQSFVDEHPGGITLLRSAIGKDATASFHGGVYNHSGAARNKLQTMMVAVLKGGMEVEIWKEQHKMTSQHAVHI